MGYLSESGLTTLWNKIKSYLTRDHLIPVVSKTYTGVIGSENNWANTVFFFGTVKPTSYDLPWRIRYKVYAEAAGQTLAKAHSDFTLWGSQSTYTAYKAFNSIMNGSYRPVYYHVYYRATSAGASAYGHAMGLRLFSSWNPITSANSRTFKIDILETENCTFSFFDEMKKYANIPGTGATNYAGYTEFDFANNGLQETGDANDVNYYNRENYASRTTTAALYRYQLCFTKQNGALVPTNTVNNSTAKTKTLTTDSFDPLGEIFYWASTSTYSAGGNVGNGYLYRQYLADLRYSFNCGGYDAAGTLTARNPLYLVTVPQSDGLVKLHTEPLAQALPSSDDGLVYIYLGRVYEDNYPYRVVLAIHHPAYWYKNGRVQAYSNHVHTVSTTSIGSASAGTAIPADDITSWSAGSVPSLTVTSTSVVTKVETGSGTAASASYANGILTITNGSTPITSVTPTSGTVGSASGWSAGSAPSLQYTAKSIPNISVTSKTVVESVTS